MLSFKKLFGLYGKKGIRTKRIKLNKEYKELLYEKQDTTLKELVDISPSESPDIFKNKLTELSDILGYYIEQLGYIDKKDIPVEIGLSLEYSCYGIDYSGEKKITTREIKDLVVFLNTLIKSDRKLSLIGNFQIPTNVRSYLLSISDCIELFNNIKNTIEIILEKKELIVLFFKIRPLVIITVYNILVIREIIEYYDNQLLS